MRDLLRRRGYAPGAIELAVGRLVDLGYVDDAGYAASFVATSAGRRAWGPRRIREELIRRGVSGERIDAALADASREGGSNEQALDRAVTRFVRARGVPVDRRDRDRLRAALARRGFGAEAIRRAIAALGTKDEDGEEIGEDES